MVKTKAILIKSDIHFELGGSVALVVENGKVLMSIRICSDGILVEQKKVEIIKFIK